MIVSAVNIERLNQTVISQLGQKEGVFKNLGQSLERQNLGVGMLGADASAKKVNCEQAHNIIAELKTFVSDKLEQLTQALQGQQVVAPAPAGGGQ